MDDLTAVPLRAQDLSADLSTSWTTEARAFVTGLVLTAAMVAAGAVVVTVALLVGAVGAPFIVAAVAYAIVRHRRAARARAWRPVRT
jgi:hypothetical protein